MARHLCRRRNALHELHAPQLVTPMAILLPRRSACRHGRRATTFCQLIRHRVDAIGPMPHEARFCGEQVDACRSIFAAPLYHHARASWRAR